MVGSWVQRAQAQVMALFGLHGIGDWIDSSTDIMIDVLAFFSPLYVDDSTLSLPSYRFLCLHLFLFPSIP